jgi:hypothetical protein
MHVPAKTCGFQPQPLAVMGHSCAVPSKPHTGCFELTIKLQSFFAWRGCTQVFVQCCLGYKARLLGDPTTAPTGETPGLSTVLAPLPFAMLLLTHTGELLLLRCRWARHDCAAPAMRGSCGTASHCCCCPASGRTHIDPTCCSAEADGSRLCTDTVLRRAGLLRPTPLLLILSFDTPLLLGLLDAALACGALS